MPFRGVAAMSFWPPATYGNSREEDGSPWVGPSAPEVIRAAGRTPESPVTRETDRWLRLPGGELGGDGAFEFDRIAGDRPLTLTYRLASRGDSEVDR